MVKDTLGKYKKLLTVVTQVKEQGKTELESCISLDAFYFLSYGNTFTQKMEAQVGT
jgi:hypothetical protein